MRDSVTVLFVSLSVSVDENSSEISLNFSEQRFEVEADVRGILARSDSCSELM